MLGGDLRCTLPIPLPSLVLVHTLILEISCMTVHLDRQGTMSEQTVKFWMCELSLAVDYLHSKKIVHRYVPSFVRLCPCLLIASIASLQRHQTR